MSFVADVVHLAGKLTHGVGIEVDAGGSGQVVQHDRHVDSRRDGLQELHRFLEAECLVVRRDDHRHRRARGLGVTGELHRLGSAHRTGLCHHGHAVGGLVDDGFDDESAFCSAHRGEFAGGSAREHAVDAAVDAAVDQQPRRALVDLAGGREWCCERSQYASELWT